MSDSFGSSFDTKARVATVSFRRRDVAVTTEVAYPSDPPDAVSDRSLATNRDASATVTLLCPGCCDQDVVLGRCHGGILAEHVLNKFPDLIPPSPKGLQGVFPPEAIVELIDGDASVFIGRRPPRGVPTKRVGAKRTLRHSRYANPFVVSKKAFSLGESLTLYRKWLSVGYRELTPDEVQASVDEAPFLPHSLEEVCIQHPELFS